MRKHFYRFLAIAVMAAVVHGSMMPAAAMPDATVDTITLETEAATEEVPVDLSWKTQRDKGQWIEEMGIAGTATSLVLIINNQDEESGEELPRKGEEESKDRPRRTTVVGTSRLLYLSKDSNGEWQEIISVNCFLSGGRHEDGEMYGVYRLEDAFGLHEDPGSLVPFHHLTSKDYWVTDEEHENFGRITASEPEIMKDVPSVNLEEMRAFCNYGMILRPESEGEAFPALVVSCQQADTNDRTFSGIQLSEPYIRMLIQSIDEETRILIAGELEDMEGM